MCIILLLFSYCFFLSLTICLLSFSASLTVFVAAVKTYGPLLPQCCHQIFYVSLQMFLLSKLTLFFFCFVSLINWIARYKNKPKESPMNYVPQQQTIIANKKKIVQYCTLFCDLLLILLFYSVLTSVQTRHTKCCYVLFDIKISKPKQRAVTLRLTDSKSHATCFLLFSSSRPHCLIHTNPPTFFFLFVIVFVRHLAIETSSEK